MQPMELITQVWCPGVPKTKGSLTFRGGHAEENVKGSARWRMLVVEAVREDLRQRWGSDIGARADLRPINVQAVFFTATDPTMPSAGDLDKLCRNVLDALSVNREQPAKGAGAYADDRQVIALQAHQVIADEVGPGLMLMVYGVSFEFMDSIRAWYISRRAELLNQRETR